MLVLLLHKRLIMSEEPMAKACALELSVMLVIWLEHSLLVQNTFEMPDAHSTPSYNHPYFSSLSRLYGSAVIGIVGIRAFPCGYVYPIPRGWPCAENRRMAEDADPWEDEEERKKWRGFCIVTRVLARQAGKRPLSELVLDNNKLPTGINHFVFDESNKEYDNLFKIVEQPSFRRIVLSLLAEHLYGYDADEWGFHRNGKISDLLAKAPHLQEAILQTDYPIDNTSWAVE
ncbi:hypothetical protein FBEOM_10100 [Fusarium beomiforme]|uniref:Uncharacterized protein n=1 Tax=Fusarium beomiforme TaxID=44412 RepID=A0A9P5ABY4_9HYPO|nr:hypothetical protein FBEOM_10100 [Fusarium beomiforme]